MKKNRFFIDCHQDIAYSIRANNRPLDTNDSRYMITLKETLKSKLGLIFSTIFVSHVKREKRYREAILQFKEYEKIFKHYNSFYTVKKNEDIKFIDKKYFGDMPTPRSEIIIDKRYLFGLITCVYHWNNAEVGSQYMVRRIPNEFNSKAQRFLDFFTI